MTVPWNKILVIQTAFIGDAILTLPLLQVLKRNYPHASVDIVGIPRTAEIFAHHPAISKIFRYDKRGRDRGLAGLLRLRRLLGEEHYDLIIVPHRSLRSAVLTRLLRPALSIGFDKSTGSRLYKKIVQYNPDAHEIERNLSLLSPLALPDMTPELPRLYPSVQDVSLVDSMMHEYSLAQYPSIIAVAPGTIWNTKRWPSERFAAVCRQIASAGSAVILLGGKEDELLCNDIRDTGGTKNVFIGAGRLSLLQSAELIRRCKVLISNDSAPMHIAVAVGTPVIAIFGATIPEYGFAPRGPNDIVLGAQGLKCRPCSIHGSDQCPIKTFDCMLSITPEIVIKNLKIFLERSRV